MGVYFKVPMHGKDNPQPPLKHEVKFLFALKKTCLKFVVFKDLGDLKQSLALNDVYHCLPFVELKYQHQ